MSGSVPGRRAGIRESVGQLASAQKSSVGTPAYLRWVNRPAGRILAALSHQAGLTPDAVSALSFATTLSALALVALTPASPLVGAVAAILLALGFALDSADGQLARLRGGGSPAGEWLDHVLDAAKHVLVPMAVLVAWWRSDVDDVWLALPLLAQLVGVLSFSGGLLHDKLRIGKVPAADAIAAPTTAGLRARVGRGSTARAVLMLPADYGSTCLVFLLWGWPTTFRVGWGLLIGVQLVMTLLFLRHWRRDLSLAARAS